MNELISVTTRINFGLDLLAPVLFMIAFIIWWRQVRHWSFGILSLALLLYLGLELLRFLHIYIHREQPFTPERTHFYVVLGLVRSCIVGTLALAGGLGLIVVGRKQAAGKHEQQLSSVV